MLLANEDVGDGALVGDFLESVLEVGSVGYMTPYQHDSPNQKQISRRIMDRRCRVR